MENIKKIQWTGSNIYEIIEFTDGSDNISFTEDNKILIYGEDTQEIIVGQYISKNNNNIFLKC